mmetsp:Transcript_22427/g.32706  ORF Transcript_22427/g.32706 Transcript_22427/m.32706 type:complete len:467 (+) Transcript_22427:111-1511(+)|eukprot:CAMPEP_0185035656 /NCGR_PEP_ID=MMETSP1103-20130426/27431_1 /TAXON_ID=36769 /ORGANISM="Paraphysomonas bandaiensis, Strain Caron Lab Isolate" /LENGTH=466 /DNA_ID=CAMNT_0027572845 /DNA_START=23 /DNA_END=1423 /DNA_ORIENTATION=+
MSGGHRNYMSINVEEGDCTSPSAPSSPWKKELLDVSLPEIHRSIAVPPSTASFFKKLMAYSGPGALVAVGYMDPGNWSTDIGGGSAYNYDLLFVILLSSIVAVFLQGLSVKAGIVFQRDLAQACRDAYPPVVVGTLWIISEVAIIATDLAEVLGSAIALKLLFGCPLIVGVVITAADVLLVLMAQGRRIKVIEAIVVILILVITVSFAMQMFLSRPNMGELAEGLFIPSLNTVTDPDRLFLAVSILGATVMPHNLFLHSSVILSRASDTTVSGKREAILFGVLDCTIALSLAFFVNAAILIVAAATFYKRGYTEVADLEDAYALLNPLLGSSCASVLFGVALLAAGQNSTLTGTMAGQIVMEGFMNWSIDPLIRRIVTRLMAIIPAVFVIIVGGNAATNTLLLFSQVVLSFALPFAVFPLVHLTSDPEKMGNFVNNSITTYIAYIIAIVISILNFVLLYYAVTGSG